jgi:hypothetical protein
MIMNQEHFPTYKPLFPVLRTQTASVNMATKYAKITSGDSAWEQL